MKSLADMDQHYRDVLAKSLPALREVRTIIDGSYEFDLSKRDVSEAVLKRLKCFYETQQAIKQLLNKRYQTAGADFFVESVIFFLQAYLESVSSDLEVHSERQVKRIRKSIRPDISVWRGEEVVAIVECKTQLGWNRNNWEDDFEEREDKLQVLFPNARAFLLVMTGRNWSGFGDNAKVGTKYFCLLDDIWPVSFEHESQILTPIEVLFRELGELLPT